MELIDTHHHLWDTRHLRYSLFDTIPALNRPFIQDDFDAIAAAHGVHRSVCVESASAGADGLMEARWLIEQASRSTVIERLVVWAPLERPDLHVYLDQIAGLDDGRIAGVRRSFEFEAPDFPRSEAVISGVKTVAEHGYSVDLVLFRESLPAVLELVRTCPEVQFILDHLGKPGVREALFHPWAEQIAEIATCTNVVCKVSGLTTEADHQHWTEDQLKPYIDHTVRCFGWDRVMFGSDWPVSNLAGGYGRWLDALNRILSSATEENKRKLFAENAERVYRLNGR